MQVTQEKKKIPAEIRRSPRLAGLSGEFDDMPPLVPIKKKRQSEARSPIAKKQKTEAQPQKPDFQGDQQLVKKPKPPNAEAVPASQPKPVAVLSTSEYQRVHEVSVTLPRNSPSPIAAPEPVQTFEQASKIFPSDLMKAVTAQGFTAPSPIQAMCWPVVMGGHDIIAIAKTGSGKTIGFLFPAFVQIKKLSLMCGRGDGPVACVVAPTRELACQIEAEAIKFAQPCRINCACIYGGVPKGPQIGKLMRGVHVLIATPGRLNDFLALTNPPVTSLKRCTYMVLDEADRMLDMGFEPQIRQVFEKLPTESKHQTLMFSATWPKAVQQLAREFLTTPVQVNIGGDGHKLFVNDDVKQEILSLTYAEKQDKLIEVLQKIKSDELSCIVFANMKSSCDRLARLIGSKVSGLTATSIHGDKEQWERTDCLKRFTEGKDKVIVATDVAARGLDIKGVSHVINFDFPTSGVEDWVHRVGRTGRAGKSGFAYTFFSEEEDRKSAAELVSVLKTAKQTIPPWLATLAEKMSRRWSSHDDSRGSRGRGRSWSGRGSSSSRGRGSWSGGGNSRGRGRGGYSGSQW